MLEAGPATTTRPPKRRCSDQRRGAAARHAARPTSRSASTTRPSTAAGRCRASPTPSASDDPARQFVWWRARMLGGRTNHWGRISLRNGPVRLQAAQPRRARLRLADQLRGPRAVLRQGRDADRRLRRERRPGEHAGFARPACCCRRPSRASASCSSSNARAKLGIPVDRRHRAVLTKRLDHERLPEAAASGQRQGAEDPGRGHAEARAPASGRRPAAAAARSGRTTSRPPCTCRRRSPPATSTSSPTRMVREVTKRKDGKADRRHLHRQKTGEEHRVKARVVVLAASALESVRILLNSGVAELAAARSASTSWTPSARTSAARSRCSRTCRRTTRTAPTAAAPVHAVVALQGAARRQARLRARLSHRVRRRPHHARHGHGRRPRMAERRQLRQEVQGRRAPLLRLVRRLRRPRRDDPERRLLRRARSRR